MEKDLQKCLGQSSCGGRFLAAMVNELNIMSAEYSGAEYNEIIRIRDLGMRLLTHDYFTEVEEIEQKLNLKGLELLAGMIMGSEKVKELEKASERANKLKKADYDNFFSSIAAHIEDWC